MTLARLVVFALLLALGCGKSRQERALDEIGRRCESFAGTRLGDADRELLRNQPFDRLSPGCDPRLASIAGGTCTESTQENAQCQIFYYWYAGADPGLCSPIGGCFAKCELRFMQNDPDAVASGNLDDSKICASRWLEGQLYP
jgi:hypothetical protein